MFKLKNPSGYMFSSLGQDIFHLLRGLGSYTLFTLEIIRNIFSGKVKFRHILDQMIKIGIDSLPITVITLTFVGMVFTNQVTKEFFKIGAGKIIGGIVGFAVWRELGPLFAGVVVAARVGAAISSEIAAMKVTEQLDALRSMAINPFSYLYVPRFIALVTMMPILIIFADFVGFISGLGIYSILYHGNPVAYLSSASQMLTSLDIYGGILFKGPVFGFIIASFSIFIGAHTKPGAVGIGESAIFSVVSILITLFIVNFFLSYFIF
ncbi:MAG: ABC transporter permease [Candidatus Margulisbacteria bacterium]|nr:ABC transporter permease [Candidatus Margulisiibacteriota bacterium]